MFGRFVAFVVKLAILGGLLWFLLTAVAEALTVGTALGILTLFCGIAVLFVILLGLWSAVDAVADFLSSLADSASYQPPGPAWSGYGPPPWWSGDEPDDPKETEDGR